MVEAVFTVLAWSLIFIALVLLIKGVGMPATPHKFEIGSSPYMCECGETWSARIHDHETEKASVEERR